MRIYLLLSGVVAISFGMALWLPTTEVLKGIAAMPSVLGLLGILYQIMRDESQHQRNLDIQKKNQIFNIGATSHMANVTFDKHVEFCEKYMAEVHECVVTLFKEGPTEKALNHAGRFYLLRQEYAAWVGEEINDGLVPFEQALRSLGARENFIQNTVKVPQYAEQRAKAIEQVYEDFKKILTIEEGKEPDPEIAVETVKRKIRKILDIEDLVQLRKRLIKEAVGAKNS